MPDNPEDLLRSIDRDTLTEVARKASGCRWLEMDDWRADRLGGGAGNPVSLALYRLSGTGQDQGQPVDWSVILKMIQSPANLGEVEMGEGPDPAHWNYWKREKYVYTSGLLDALPEGVAAPRCYGVQDLPGDIAWLWMEDIRDVSDGVWTQERFALTARLLGQINGSFNVRRPFPSFPWLGDNLLGQWIAQWRPAIQAMPWEHPRMHARYDAQPTFRRMLEESDRFIHALSRLPRTICHGDTYPTNFMLRRAARGEKQTVALDWALVNVAPLGDDLGQFVFGAHMLLKDLQPAALTQALFEEYIAGLRKSGCKADPRQVRFAFAATAALRVGMFSLLMFASRLGTDPAAGAQEGQSDSVVKDFEERMAQMAYEALESLAS